MMLHRHFEALKEKIHPNHGMDVKEGEDMLVTREGEQHQEEPQAKRTRKRKSVE